MSIFESVSSGIDIFNQAAASVPVKGRFWNWQRALGREVQPGDLSLEWSARFTRPFHLEVHFVASVCEVDHFIRFHSGFDAAQIDAVSADVNRNDVLGEHPVFVVAAKDAH